jgi:hypothetical protein
MRDKWKPVTEEDLQRIVDKWRNVLNPPLSSSKVTAILLESQEKWLTQDEILEVCEYHKKHFKHDSDYNPEAHIKVLIDNKLRNKNI